MRNTPLYLAISLALALPVQAMDRCDLKFWDRDCGSTTETTTETAWWESDFSWKDVDLSQLLPEQFDLLSVAEFLNWDVGHLRELSGKQVRKIRQQEFGKLPAATQTDFFLNFDPRQVTAEDLGHLLPEGWQAQKNGRFSFAPRTEVSLPRMAQRAGEQISLPQLADFGKKLCIGGEVEGVPSMLEEVGTLLVQDGFPDFTIEQHAQSGMLHVRGGGVEFSFLPPVQVRQAEADYALGIMLRHDGAYDLITPGGFQLTLNPAPVMLPDLSRLAGDALLKLAEDGVSELQLPGQGKLAGRFQPLVQGESQNRQPGFYVQGEPGRGQKVEVVLEDGRMQEMRPAIRKPDEFTHACKRFPGVRDVTLKTDGEIEVETSNDDQLRFVPSLEVAEPETPVETPLEPIITVKEDNSAFVFTDSEGNQQEVFLQEEPVETPTEAPEESVESSNEVSEAPLETEVTEPEVTEPEATEPEATETPVEPIEDTPPTPPELAEGSSDDSEAANPPEATEPSATNPDAGEEITEY